MKWFVWLCSSKGEAVTSAGPPVPTCPLSRHRGAACAPGARMSPLRSLGCHPTTPFQGIRKDGFPAGSCLSCLLQGQVLQRKALYLPPVNLAISPQRPVSVLERKGTDLAPGLVLEPPVPSPGSRGTGRRRTDPLSPHLAAGGRAGRQTPVPSSGSRGTGRRTDLPPLSPRNTDPPRVEWAPPRGPS